MVSASGVLMFGPDVLEELAALRAVIELKGMVKFEPNRLLGNFIKSSGPGGAVLPARFGTIASGNIIIRYENGGYQTDVHWLPMRHPEFRPRDPARMVGLAVQITDSRPSGWISVAVSSPGGLVTDPRAKTGEDPELWRVMFGRSYHGPESVAPSSWENTLENGELKLATTLRLSPPDGPSLWGLFSLYNEQVNFAAIAEVSALGLEQTNVVVSREATGLIAWRKPIQLAHEWKGRGISGQVQASFVDGSFEARGRLTVAYPASNPRLRGEINVVATSAERAWATARSHNPAPEIVPGLEPITPATGMALMGWGALDLRITRGLDAKAAFLVDPEGHLTARGVLRAPRELELIPAYPWNPPDPFEDSWELAGAYLYPGVRGKVQAGVTLGTGARIGPVRLRDFVIMGSYSTRPGTGSFLDLSASLNASLEAWVEVSAWLEAAVEVGLDLPQYCLLGICTPDLDIDVVSVRVALTGKGTLRAYAEVRPRIIRIGATDPAEEAMYGVSGHLEVGGQFDVMLEPKLLLGSVFAGSRGPRFGFGGGKYPIAGGAIALDFEHIIGGASPTPVFTFHRIPFDAKKFVENLRAGGETPRDKSKKGKYVDPSTGKVAPIKDTPIPPLGPLPEPTYELRVPFEIANRAHRLWLKLSDPPVVDVETRRERLSEKLFTALGRVENQLTWASSDRTTLLGEQIIDLRRLIKAARDLEEEAKKLGDDPTDLVAADLPGLVDLATQLAEYGERYGDLDLTGSWGLLPAGDLEQTVVGPEQPILPGTNTPVIDAELAAFFSNHGFTFDAATGVATKIDGPHTQTAQLDAEGRWVLYVNGVQLAREYDTPLYKNTPERTGNFFNAHHPVQDAWAEERLRAPSLPNAALKNPKIRYRTGDEPTILLRNVYRGTPHQRITARQNQRLGTIDTRDYDTERAEVDKDLAIAGVPGVYQQELMEKADAYFKTLHDNIKDPAIRKSIFGDYFT
jgi:hypothetical protein